MTLFTTPMARQFVGDELACHWRGKEGHLISPFQSETGAASRYGKAAFT